MLLSRPCVRIDYCMHQLDGMLAEVEKVVQDDGKYQDEVFRSAFWLWLVLYVRHASHCYPSSASI